jgi:hypothetical protein
MNFIEHLFGVSPDGGSGVSELLYVAAVLSIVALYRWRTTLAAIIRRSSG